MNISEKFAALINAAIKVADSPELRKKLVVEIEGGRDQRRSLRVHDFRVGGADATTADLRSQISIEMQRALGRDPAQFLRDQLGAKLVTLSSSGNDTDDFVSSKIIGVIVLGEEYVAGQLAGNVRDLRIVAGEFGESPVYSPDFAASLVLRVQSRPLASANGDLLVAAAQQRLAVAVRGLESWTAATGALERARRAAVAGAGVKPLGGGGASFDELVTVDGEQEAALALSAEEQALLEEV